MLPPGAPDDLNNLSRDFLPIMIHLVDLEPADECGLWKFKHTKNCNKSFRSVIRSGKRDNLLFQLATASKSKLDHGEGHGCVMYPNIEVKPFV